MAHIFTVFLLTSVTGSLLALILTLLRPLTRRTFSGAWHYYMWLVVILVMLLPIKLTLPEKPSTITPVSQHAIISDNIEEISEVPVITETQPPQITQEKDTQSQKETAILNATNIFVKNSLLLSFVWLAGALTALFIKLIGYAVFLAKMHKHSTLISCPEIKTYTDRKIKVRVTDTICSPLMIGIIKPTLLLPKANITPEQLHYILSHEMTHLKRNDVLYKWFVSLTKCVHWFNPAIYFISRQIDMDCEISCDLAVIKKLDEKSEKNYAETILALLTQNNSKHIPLTTGMAGNKKMLKKRFMMIKEKIKISKKTAIISAIIFILILGVTIFTSGILNGKLLNAFNDSWLELNTDKVTGDDFNLLFVGIDNNNKADTIMLLTIKKDSINGISIPRNTMFEGKIISDILSQKNGDQAAIDAIKKNLSVPVHYYAKMNLSAIEKIVDSVGGIYFEVPMNMVYDDPYQNLHINLKKGTRTLNGNEVRQLLQFRHGYTEGDLSRIQLHQQFVKEFISRKLNKENIGKAREIYEIISDNVKTNYPIDNLKHDLQIISAIKSSNISFETLPGKTAVVDQLLVYEALSGSKDTKNTKISLLWPTESKTVTNGFGKRIHPITFEEKTHNGIDISAPENSSVVSSISGKVTDTGFDNEFGNYVVIQNDSGVKLYYGHLSSVNVSKGDKLKQNDVIGKVGKTGKATGPNLHFEIQINGEYYDPMAFWQENQNETEKKTVGSVKIKSELVSNEPYAGFEHLVLKNADTNKIEQELNRQGVTKANKSTVDLTKNYIVKDLKSEQTNVESDKNGNISLYFSVDSDNLFDVCFYDAETNEDVASYGVLANNENAYTFMGFEKDKTYNVKVQGSAKNDWVINGNYIIY